VVDERPDSVLSDLKLPAKPAPRAAAKRAGTRLALPAGAKPAALPLALAPQINLARDLFLSGKLDEADAVARKAAELQPTAASSHRFQVMVAVQRGDGETALRRATELKPDLILLDLFLPGMDGFGALTGLRRDSKTADTPVIFMSAHEDIAETLRAFEAGGVDCIAKPLHLGETLARIRTHLQWSMRQRQLLAENERLRRGCAPREERQ